MIDRVNGQSERVRWTASADAWDRWADPMADMADKFNQPLLDAAGVTAGDHVLDLASGAGEPALSTLARVGDRGLVIGSDLVPSMLYGARRRAGVLQGLSFLAADMTSLPFASASFDRATCRFGIMFVPDHKAALVELRRVIRPGGRIAFMVWGAMADNALFTVLGSAVADQLGDNGGLASLFRFSAPQSLAAGLQDVGFREVTEQALTPSRKVPARFAHPGTAGGPPPFWMATLEMCFADRLASLTAPQRTALEADISQRFAAMAMPGSGKEKGRQDDPMITLPAHVRIVSGTA